MKKKKKLILGSIGLVVIAILGIVILGLVNAAKEPLVGRWVMYGGNTQGNLPLKFSITKENDTYILVWPYYSSPAARLPLSGGIIQVLTFENGKKFNVYSFKFQSESHSNGTIYYDMGTDGFMRLSIFGETANYKKAGLFDW